MVPEQDFDVTADDHAVTVRALRGRLAGSTLHLSGVMMLMLPLPTNLRLRTFVDSSSCRPEELPSVCLSLTARLRRCGRLRDRRPIRLNRRRPN
jgi:hypothetical protein